MGVWLKMEATRSLVNIFRFCSAGKKPGAMAFTLMLCAAHSLDKYWVILFTPAFDRLYVKTFDKGGPEETEDILMILPNFC